MKIVIDGFYGVNNLGDDYILYSLLNTLSGIKKKRVFIVIIGSGDTYDHILSLFPNIHFRIINRMRQNIFYKVKRKIALAWSLMNANLYIFGGGGVLTKDEPSLYMSLLKKLRKCRKYHVKKTAIYGIDVCKIESPLSKTIWQEISNNVDYMCFRNRFSADTVNSFLKVKRAFSAPDITFSLITNVEGEEASKSFRELYPMISGEYIVWILAMPWNETELKDDSIWMRYNRLCDLIVAACNRYTSYNFLNIFLPFYHRNDSRFINDVRDRLAGNYIALEENQVCFSAKRMLMMNARASVSMRFHGIAFSLYYGIPVAAISYAPKSTQILLENGLSDYCTEFGIRKETCFFKEFDINPGQLFEICDRAILKNDRLKFEKVGEKLRADAKENENKLIELVIKRV